MYRDPAQWTQIQERAFKEGISQRQICRETGISRKVVAKMLASPCPSRPAIRQWKRPRLGSFVASIERLLGENESLLPATRLTKQAIYERICQEGFAGSYSTVCDFIRTRSLRTTSRRGLTKRLPISLPLTQTKVSLLSVLPIQPPVDSAKKPAMSREVQRAVAWAWMHDVLQGSIAVHAMESELPDFPELAKLLDLVVTERLSIRNKALTVLAHRRGIPATWVRQFLHISKQTHLNYRRTFSQGGLDGLFAQRISRTRKFDDEAIKQAVFSTLHEPPSTYGINRTTWKMQDLSQVLREHGYPASKDVIHRIVHDAGYRWRKARVVLTSKDPDYKGKLERIHSILANLQEDEAFFSIDEFGPFAIKMQGGRVLTAPDEQPTVPQWQQSKGCLIMTAALELSRNQVTHFYSEKKNTDEMIRMLERLLQQYGHLRKFYLSWDAASWHIAKKLESYIRDHNDRVAEIGGPIVETAPLPSGAQFLNVIESVFSGMARAIIHHSNYESVEAATHAINRHFADRNAEFETNPRRAGKKIWGQEREQPAFAAGNNCKDPHYR